MVFAGSESEQAAAREAMAVLLQQGRFMATNAPITVAVSALVAFLADKRGLKADVIEAALVSNPSNFRIEGEGDDRSVTTSRSGRAPAVDVEKFSHSFAQRFMTPKPKPAVASAV